MRFHIFRIFPAVLLAAVSLTTRADEKFPVLQIGSETYTNVTITKVTATDIFFFHSKGMGNAKIKSLPPELQKHFNYDAAKAAATEARQADNKAKYHEQLLHQPAPRPVEAKETTAAPAAPAIWREDFPGALKQAQSENKRVLLDFTGSDWCPWCIKFDHDVLSTSKFAAYAGQNLELVKVDFPRHTQLPDEQRRANDALARQFGVDGYPTYVLLNPAGSELGRQVGYLDGGPDAFVAELEKFSGR